MTAPDVRYWFDPVCPYCWLTSGWVRTVARRRGLTVQWQFISLRLLNAHVDYAAQFPPEYEAGHTAGLRLLRACAAVREAHGDEALGRFYEALGDAVFEQGEVPEHSSERELFDRARALGNQIVWVSANQAGTFGSMQLVASAKIVDPGGEVLATTGTRAGLAVAAIDVDDAVDSARRFMGHLRDRRQGSYAPVPA